MSKILDPEIECLSKNDLAKLQYQRIKNVLISAQSNSPLYKEKLGNIDLSVIKSLEDIVKLPFTTKDELVKRGPYCTLAIPTKEVIEVHFSSGTTRAPVASFLSKKDVEESNKALSRTWYMQGVRESSTFGMLASYGLFSAGLINHYAIQDLGAFVVPISGASTEKIIQLIDEFNIDIVAAVSSNYFHILRRMKEHGIDPKKSHLHTIIAGGEPFTELQRKFIETNFNVRLYDQYGLCEINTGLAGECEAQDGLHLQADYAYPEIIDPKTGRVLPEGKTGELVMTTLCKEASPLIRYRTGDITSISYKRCACGRTLPRIKRIKERVSKTIFHKGLKLERDYISDVVAQASEYIDPYLWKFIFSTGTIDPKAEIKVNSQEKHSEETVRNYLSAHIKRNLGFHVQVTFFEQREIKALEGHKFQHFEEIQINL